MIDPAVGESSPRITHVVVCTMQVENEYGWFGSDKVYLIHLVHIARKHLGENVLL